MRCEIKLLNFFCYTYRKAGHVVNKGSGYNYVLYAYYMLNDQLIIVNTLCDKDTLQQVLEQTSQYHYLKKPTAYQMRMLLEQQHCLINSIVNDKNSNKFNQYLDITTIPQEQEIMKLDRQYQNDNMNVLYLRKKQELSSQLSSIICGQVFNWYKQNAKVVDYSEFRLTNELKMCLDESPNCYLIFLKEKQ